MKIFLILFSLFLVVSCTPQKKIAGNQKPNIIFIMTDDHSRKAMSAYSNELIKTPNLDRIANEGLKFNNAFVTNSICGPSRAVALTGKHSHINGFKANFDRFDGSQMTLPKYLTQAGYYTAIVGKWHLVSVPQGFDEYSVMVDQGEYYSPQFFDGKDTVTVEGYATEIITKKAIDLFERQKNSGKPVFLMLHQKAPHRNWMPNISDLETGGEKVYPFPETFFDDYATRSKAAAMQDMRVEDMYLGYDLKLYLKELEPDSGGDERSAKNSYGWMQGEFDRMTAAQRSAWEKYYKPITEAYYSSKPIGDEMLKWKYNRYMNDYLKTVKSVDDNIGILLNYLEKNKLDKNTLIIYTSDQGFFLGEHGWFDKRFMYEPSLAIPLVMRYPGKIKAGITTDKLVQNLDFAPTILKAAGVEVPADMQGKPLDVFFKGKDPENWQKEIYYHFYESNAWHQVQKHFGIRTERYKLIYFYDLKDWELYDLQKDPNELDNLYRKSEYQDLANHLKKELKKLIVKYKDNTAVEF